MFSEKLLGDGVAIIPQAKQIYSLFDLGKEKTFSLRKTP